MPTSYMYILTIIIIKYNTMFIIHTSIGLTAVINDKRTLRDLVSDGTVPPPPPPSP